MPQTQSPPREFAPAILRDSTWQHAASPPRQLELDPEAALVRAVDQALRASGHLALRHVEVEICAGVIVLWGRVPTYYLKQLAQSVAQRVEGVRSIANGLDVVCSR